MLFNSFSNMSTNASLNNGIGLHSNQVPSPGQVNRMMYSSNSSNNFVTQSLDSSAFTSSEDRSKTNLIVNYLPQNFEQNDLYKLFEAVGPIRQCKLIRDKSTGASLCYGFVDYVSSDSASAAINRFHAFEIDQKRLRVAFASAGAKQRQGGSGCGMYGLENIDGGGMVSGWEVGVGGIPCHWSEEDLAKIFGAATLKQVRILPNTDPDSLSGASTATLIYEDKASADMAASRLNGFTKPDWAQSLIVKVIGPQISSPGYSGIRGRGSTLDTITSEMVFDNEFDLLSGRGANNFSQRRLNRGQNGDEYMNLMNNFSKQVSLDNLSNGSNSVRMNAGRPIVKNKVSENCPDNLFRDNSISDGMVNQRVPQSYSPIDHYNSVDYQQALLASMKQQNSNNPDSANGVGRNVFLSSSSTSGAPFNVFMDSSGPSSGVGSGSPNVVLPCIYVKTPLIQSKGMSALMGNGTKVWLKLENTQPSGSFKLRGIANFCRKAANSGCTRLVSSSGGNAGLAAAYACSQLGLPLTVVVPDSTPLMMRQKIEMEGADVQVFGTTWSEAHARAQELVNRFYSGNVQLLHPFDHVELWEGYETIIDELANELTHKPDAVVCAVGGGGLLNGIIQGLYRHRWTNTSVIAMETQGADCLNQALLAKHPVTLPSITSIAKSLGASTVSSRTWELVNRFPVCSSVCSDADAVSSVRQFLDDHNMLVEPACGAALATVYAGIINRLQSERKLGHLSSVVIVVCGGRAVNSELLNQWEQDLSLNFGVHDSYSQRVSSGLQLPHKQAEHDDEEEDADLVMSQLMQHLPLQNGREFNNGGYKREGVFSSQENSPGSKSKKSNGELNLSSSGCSVSRDQD